jgi:putative FmdB family regulatory protein
MPIYEYSCLECGAQFERLVRPGEPVVCAACESRRVSRRLSLVALRTESRAPVSGGGGGGCCGGGGCGCNH